ncbi:MAG: hypothetical protein NTY23_12790 [Chloroflexi bacterium]|nr:hypothetical protein [Chloroflexota bacterium]
MDDVSGCFSSGHRNFISDDRFFQLCRKVAQVQNPASVDQRFDTLQGTLPNLQSARQSASLFNKSLVRTTAEDLLLNTLSLAIYSAALRHTGAEAGDVAYFYKRGPHQTASIFLFDTDDFGNGTADLAAETFHVSAVERILTARQRALGGHPDPLPSTDFASCLEDALQECDSSHASHMAYYDVRHPSACFDALRGACEGERHIAGAAMDFMRTRLGLRSFDHSIPLQACPEFLAYVSQYPCYAGAALVPSPTYPSFQALESAMGFCVDGCINCVVSPEQNLRGVLTAKDTVSKLLLDAAYRFVVCEAAGSTGNLCYPGTSTGRTENWDDLALCLGAAMAQSPAGAAPMAVELDTPRGSVTVTVLVAAAPGPWSIVFRPNWDEAGVPGPRVRPRMVF